MYFIIYGIFNVLMIFLLVSNMHLRIYINIILIIAGLILFLLDINKLKRLKEEAGEILFEFESERKTSPILQLWANASNLLFILLALVLLYKIPEALIYFILIYGLSHEIYLDYSAGSFASEKGLFYKGMMFDWYEILSYKWDEPRISYPKGYLILVLEVESKFWISKVKLKVKDSQKKELEQILKERRNFDF